MKILSWNVNGLRAVHKKNFSEWLAKSGADIVCLQEVKAQADTVPEELWNPAPYFGYFTFAQKKGYSGVAVYTKEKPVKVVDSLKMERFDSEGRMLELHFASGLVLFNLYIPNGDRTKKNIPYKLEVYKKLFGYLKNFVTKDTLLIGDFNVAHEEIDLARPKDNQNNTMFTPEERKQLDYLTRMGFADTFRALHREGEAYTWWPYFVSARARNLGWRIDYAFSSPSLTKKLKGAFILPEVMGSDHCPVGVEF